MAYLSYRKQKNGATYVFEDEAYWDKDKKKTLLIGFVLLLVFSAATLVSGKEDNSDEISENFTSDTELNQEVEIVERDDGNLELIPHDVESFIENSGIEKPSKDAELLKIIRVRADEAKNFFHENLDDEDKNSPASTNHIRVVPTGTSQGTYWDRIARTRNMCSIPSGCSALTVSISETRGFTSSFSATVGVDAVVVSAGVGFTIGQNTNTTVTGSATEPVDFNRFLVIDAYPRISITGFEVEERFWYGFPWNRTGSGSAWRVVPNEIDFVVFIQ